MNNDLAEVDDDPSGFRFAILGPDVDPPLLALFFEGVCEGSIAREKHGAGGFGYDPIFLADAYPGRTLAEVSHEEKNAVSHRGKALRAMAAWLKSR